MRPVLHGLFPSAPQPLCSSSCLIELRPTDSHTGGFGDLLARPRVEADRERQGETRTVTRDHVGGQLGRQDRPSDP